MSPSQAQIQALLEQALEQAQVFASAWSLVGSAFDDGGALEHAQAQKQALHQLLKTLVAVAGAAAQPRTLLLAQDCQPLQTIEHWAAAYSNPASGVHFQGHGMAAQLLQEYARLRASIEAEGAAP